MVRQRARIRFRKQGDLRYLGHRDLARTWERWLRRANVALVMSQGFHPRPRINFPSALASGVEGTDEALELEFEGDLSLAELAERLALHAPPGLELASLESLPPSGPAAQACGMTYELDIPDERAADVERQLEAIRQDSAVWVQREDDRPPVNLTELIEEVTLDAGTLRIRLRVDRSSGVRPRELLAAWKLEDLIDSGGVLRRTAVELDA